MVSVVVEFAISEIYSKQMSVFSVVIIWLSLQ